MRGPSRQPRSPARRLPWWSGGGAVLTLLLASCSSGAPVGGGLAEPAHSVAPVPDYLDACAPVGADTSGPCLRITLDALDAARGQEGLRPMALPSDFPELTVPEQLFVAVDRERVDRGLAPFTGLTPALDSGAQEGADAARLPARPGPGYASVTTEWIGDVDNGLDADFQWLYDDGPDSGVPGCSGNQTSGCWADRKIVLDRFGSRHLVMGAAFDPTGDTSSEDHGGSSLAVTLATSSHAGGYAYTWKQALAATSAGTLRPLRAIPSSESATGIRDPGHNVAPVPDFTRVCADGGLDDSAACIGAALGRHQSRPRARRHPPHGAPAGLRSLERARSALRRGQPRAGGSGAPGLRRPHDRPQPECAAGRGRRQRPARSGTGLRPRRRGMGRRILQRARRRVRVDVRRRVRQRQPRLPAP